MAKLERLIKVPLREFWEGEASDFTPWLAHEENIDLLGETIGSVLDVEAQEKKVGPFKADILCKDIVTDNWVVIENQLEPTDHTHLGQLLTYAAGLDAITAVWIAERFTDGHRAALDWLNGITAEGFSFFGLEIELWRIGDSPIAPKFNVVSHPNDWTKTVDQVVHRKLTSTQQLYFDYWTVLQDYWTALQEHLEERNGVINPVARSRDSGVSVGVGRFGFWLRASASGRDKWISVSLALAGRDRKPHFYLLEKDKVDIEKEIGAELVWEEKPGLQDKHIKRALYDADPGNRQDWNRQHQWLCEQLEAFHRVFSPRVKELDVSDYVPEEGETAE